MKKLVITLIVSLMATSAFAVLDPDPNMLGTYLDVNADVVCGPAPVMPFDIYVILTNPTYVDVKGVEFGWTITSGVLYLNGQVSFPTDAVNLGATTATSGEVAAGFAAPIPTTEATVMATIPCFHFGGPFDMVLRSNQTNPSGSNPDLPTILDGGGDIVMVGLSAGVGGVSLAVGTACEGVVATESTTFDSLKSLYR